MNLLPLLAIQLDALLLSALGMLTAAFVLLKGWKEYVRGEVDKSKEQSVGATALEDQDGKITEIKNELNELKLQVKDNASLRIKVDKLEQDFMELLKQSVNYWRERGRF
jgi:Tfp pilus assembly protein PilO